MNDLIIYLWIIGFGACVFISYYAGFIIGQQLKLMVLVLKGQEPARYRLKNGGQKQNVKRI